jgi:hypothetical protein
MQHDIHSLMVPSTYFDAKDLLATVDRDVFPVVEDTGMCLEVSGNTRRLCLYYYYVVSCIRCDLLSRRTGMLVSLSRILRCGALLDNPIFLGSVQRSVLEDVLREVEAEFPLPDEDSDLSDDDGHATPTSSTTTATTSTADQCHAMWDQRIPYVFGAHAPSDTRGICRVDPTAFQIAEQTSLKKVHYIFTMLGLGHTFVTSKGRLVGFISKNDLIDLNNART